jgi:hypothetical protein
LTIIKFQSKLSIDEKDRLVYAIYNSNCPRDWSCPILCPYSPLCLYNVSIMFDYIIGRKSSPQLAVAHVMRTVKLACADHSFHYAIKRRANFKSSPCNFCTLGIHKSNRRAANYIEMDAFPPSKFSRGFWKIARV